MQMRTIRLKPGEEKFITADEVRDEALRAKLQIRAVSIVRPSTEAEEDALAQEIEEEESASKAREEAEEPEGAEESSDNLPL